MVVELRVVVNFLYQAHLRLHIVGTVRGIIPYARFGSRLAFSPKTGALFVSAPLQDTLSMSFNGREMGAVFGFQLVCLNFQHQLFQRI